MALPSEAKRKRKVKEEAEEEEKKIASSSADKEQEKVGYNMKCHVCETIMRLVAQSLEANQTIDAAVDGACGTFLWFLKGACQSVLEPFKQQIKEASKKSVKPSDLCQQIELCGSEAVPEEQLEIVRLPDPCLRRPEDWCESKETAALYKKEAYCLQLQINGLLKHLSSGQQEVGSSEEEHSREEKNSSEEKKEKERKKRKSNKKKKKSKKGKKQKGKKDKGKKDKGKKDKGKKDKDKKDKDKKDKDKKNKLCPGCAEKFKSLVATVGDNLDKLDEITDSGQQEVNSTEEATSSEDKTRKRRMWHWIKRKGRKGRRKKNKKHKWCSGCIEVVEDVKTAAGENPDEDAINKALDAMCNEVHNHVARICWAMQENRVELKEAMKNKASSPEFCKQIQMCSGKPRVHAHGPTGSDLKRCQTCTMCQAFTSLVKPQLDKKEPEKDLGPLIAKGCSEHFGNSTGCKKFVTHYEAKLKLVLSKSWDHITTCRSVGACNSGAVATATRDLADNKCKEGPESWCQSIESAINCNALSYCVKAWKI